MSISKGYSRFVATLHLAQHPDGRQMCMATYLDSRHVLTSADCCIASDTNMPLGDLMYGQTWDDYYGNHISDCAGSQPVPLDNVRIEGNYCIINHWADFYQNGVCYDGISAPCIK